MKFLKNKTWIFLGLLFVFCIGFIGSIYAYLADADATENIFIIGGVNTEVVEEFTPPEKLSPGISFTKDVKIKNHGPSECFVRVKAVFTDSDMGSFCTVNFNTTDYVYNDEDGYYYYTKPLAVGELTTSLFSTVKVSESIPVSEIKDFDIIVYEEAYQSTGFRNYEEAWNHYQRNNING